VADQYGLRAAYDAHYVALAEEIGSVPWTDDQRLLVQLGGMHPNVRALDSYPNP